MRAEPEVIVRCSHHYARSSGPLGGVTALADGFYDRWLVNLDRSSRELPTDTTWFIGHGQPVAGHAILDWQSNYIQRFLEVLRSGVQRDGLQGDALADAVTAQIKVFLPKDDLLFLMRLSVEPMRLRLGLRAREKHAAADPGS
jgi:hypothetical protein